MCEVEPPADICLLACADKGGGRGGLGWFGVVVVVVVVRWRVVCCLRWDGMGLGRRWDGDGIGWEGRGEGR